MTKEFNTYFIQDTSSDVFYGEGEELWIFNSPTDKSML